MWKLFFSCLLLSLACFSLCVKVKVEMNGTVIERENNEFLLSSASENICIRLFHHNLTSSYWMDVRLNHGAFDGMICKENTLVGPLQSKYMVLRGTDGSFSLGLQVNSLTCETAGKYSFRMGLQDKNDTILTAQASLGIRESGVSLNICSVHKKKIQCRCEAYVGTENTNITWWKKTAFEDNGQSIQGVDGKIGYPGRECPTASSLYQVDKKYAIEHDLHYIGCQLGSLKPMWLYQQSEKLYLANDKGASRATVKEGESVVLKAVSAPTMFDANWVKDGTKVCRLWGPSASCSSNEFQVSVEKEKAYLKIASMDCNVSGIYSITLKENASNWVYDTFRLHLQRKGIQTLLPEGSLQSAQIIYSCTGNVGSEDIRTISWIKSTDCKNVTNNRTESVYCKAFEENTETVNLQCPVEIKGMYSVKEGFIQEGTAKFGCVYTDMAKPMKGSEGDADYADYDDVLWFKSLSRPSINVSRLNNGTLLCSITNKGYPYSPAPGWEWLRWSDEDYDNCAYTDEFWGDMVVKKEREDSREPPNENPPYPFLMKLVIIILISVLVGFALVILCTYLLASFVTARMEAKVKRMRKKRKAGERARRARRLSS